MTNVTDEDWDAALARLQGYELDGGEWRFTGRFNTAPLGELMARGEQVPIFISQQIGSMLDPPATWCSLRFSINGPKKRDFRQKAHEIKEKIDARKRYEALCGEGYKKEAAIAQVMQEFRKKRTWVRSATKTNMADVILPLFDARHIV